jgi:outer membrane biogenesis lipoprotein LolB
MGYIYFFYKGAGNMNKNTVVLLTSLLFIIFLQACTQSTGSNQDSYSKLDEYLDEVSYKQTSRGSTIIKYNLKKEFPKSDSGLLTQQIYFKTFDDTESIPLSTSSVGKNSLKVEGNPSNIKLIFNGSNKYIEEKKLTEYK